MEREIMAQTNRQTEKRPRGRPSGPPLARVNMRLPSELLERLDRYIDYELRWSHEGDINRTSITKQLLEAFLDAKGY